MFHHWVYSSIISNYSSTVLEYSICTYIPPVNRTICPCDLQLYFNIYNVLAIQWTNRNKLCLVKQSHIKNKTLNCKNKPLLSCALTAALNWLLCKLCPLFYNTGHTVSKSPPSPPGFKALKQLTTIYKCQQIHSYRGAITTGNDCLRFLQQCLVATITTARARW